MKAKDGKTILYQSATCLLPEVTEVEWTWLRMFSHYKRGYLYQAGGISDQPAKYLRAVELLENHTG